MSKPLHNVHKKLEEEIERNLKRLKNRVGRGEGEPKRGGGIQSVNTLPAPKKNLNQTAAEETRKKPETGWGGGGANRKGGGIQSANTHPISKNNLKQSAAACFLPVTRANLCS